MRDMVVSIAALLAVAAAAGFAQEQEQEPAPDPFAPLGAPVQGWAQGALPGAEARYEESLARLGRRLDADPADVAALERAVGLLGTVGRTERLLPRVRRALAGAGLEPDTEAALHSLLGHLLVVKGDAAGGRVQVWIIGPGGAVQRQGNLDEETRKLLQEAVVVLGRALERRPGDARAMRDLASALSTLDDEANADEARRLRREAAALDARDRPPPVTMLPFSRDWSGRAEDLRGRAEELEQLAEGPRHDEALRLRYEALVIEQANGTVPFAYDAALDEPAALLAPEPMVRRNLSRSYVQRSGEIDRVPVQYHPPTPARRWSIVQELGRDPSAGATALLLSVLLRSGTTDPLGDAALDALARGARPELRTHLAALLTGALGSERTDLYPPSGQRRLVRLAARLRDAPSAPVLVARLARPRDLLVPRGIPEALGAIGRPQDAAPLLRLARDATVDVYFRRRAVDGLGALGVDLPADLAEDPALALSVTAARLARAPDEALEGRLLAALDDELLADDAAAYCADLGLKKAIPAIEGQLTDRAKEAVAGPLTNALTRLRKSP